MNSTRLEIIKALSKMIPKDPSAEDPKIRIIGREEIFFSNVKEPIVVLVEGKSKGTIISDGPRKYPDEYYSLSKNAKYRFRKKNRKQN